MPKHTYPIIFILNPETEFFNGYIPDLAIFAEGRTLEEVYSEMEEILQNYMTLAVKYNTEVPEASTLDAITKKWPGYKVSLISAATK